MHDAAPAAADAALLRVRADDPEYQRLAAAEAEFWSRPRPYSLESLEAVFDDGPFEQYVNWRFTGDPQRGWWETIAAYGPFRRGLALGTSAINVEGRILETNPALHLEFVDISAGALERRASVLGARFPGRVATRVADLNFLALAPDSYDLVVSAASVHHVTNLEWLARQLAAALRPGGHLFLQDYVGEPRFQFAPLKKRLLEAFSRVSNRRLGGDGRIVWRDQSDLSPFCGVRADEILPVLGGALEPLQVRTSSALLVPLYRATAAAPPPPLPRLHRWRGLAEDAARRLTGRRPRLRSPIDPLILAQLLALDEILLDAEVVLPGIAFAIYRRRP